MPSTYTPQDAITLVKAYIKGIPVSNVGTASIGAQACDAVNTLIWNQFYWRWSVKAFTPLACSDGVQDYPFLPGTSNPSPPLDFHRLQYVRIVRTDLTPNEFRELVVLNFISPELSRKGSIDTIRDVTIVPESGSLRLTTAVGVSGTQVIQLQGSYQFEPPKITDGNLQVPFLFLDTYYYVFIEGLRWWLYKYADDPRAGSMSINRRGEYTATGQLAEFLHALSTMLRSEDTAQGNQSVFPENSLGWTRASNPGLFGF